jgi:hypothetical protein
MSTSGHMSVIIFRRGGPVADQMKRPIGSMAAM